MAPKKPTMLDRFNKLFPMIVMLGSLGGAGGIVWWVSGYVEHNKTVTFTDSEMKYKTELRTNQDIDPVTLSWKEDTLSKRTDTMIQQQRGLDTMLIINKKMMDSILTSNAKRD